MTLKTLIGSTLLVTTLFAGAPSTFANEPETITLNTAALIELTDAETATSSVIVAEITTESAARAELKSLKLKEQDPQTGFFTRLIIGFKIKQLENQLNIKKALK